MMRKFELLGVRITPATIDELHTLMHKAVEQGRKLVLANHNLHSLYLFHHHQSLSAFFARSDIAHIDGMPIVFLAKLFGHKVTREHRVTYVDWIRPLTAEAQRAGWRVFALGGRPGVGEAAAAVLRRDLPSLSIMSRDGYFDPTPGGSENTSVVSMINAFRPHVLMVGMGMPRQEEWILQNIDELDVNVILPSGACMDYVAGAVPTPPRWMGRIGIEWAYRLACEPRRLATRYLFEPWFILGMVVQEAVQHLLGRRTS